MSVKYAPVLPFLLAALLGIAPGQSPSPPEIDPSSATERVPETSVVPAATTIAPAVSALQAELGSMVRERGWSSAEYSVLVMSLDRGDTLFALNPDLALAPASNMKLYTTAAALYYLGPDFRFSTYVLGEGALRDSVFLGDVILYGTGDPTISGRMLGGSTETFEAMADSLRALGIREIQGDIVGDGSYYDDQRLGSAWNPDDLMAWYAAPIGALSFAENVVSVRVLPGAVGGPARIQTNPETRDLPIANNVRTVRSGGTRVRFEHGPRGIVVTGQIRRNHPGVARSIPAVDPAQYAAAAFLAALESREIEVSGSIRAVHDASESRVTFAFPAGSSARGGDPTIPTPRVLTVHLSPPLSDIIEVTNVESHNLFAEALLKQVGRVALGEGSWQAGARAIQYMLSCETAVDTAALFVVDGSGLSRTNRTSARNTVHLLELMADSQMWNVYYASLPEAADRDGLRRMEGTAAAGNLRAKTGTIKNVSALSGYVEAANGERLAFSIIANHVPSTWRAKRLEDALGARLASFARPPEQVEAPVPPLTSPSLTDADTSGDPAMPPRPGQEAREPAPPEPRLQSHRVRQGDTLDEIARQFGVTVAALQEANPGVSPRRLQVGQELTIPSSGEAESLSAQARTYRIRSGDTLDGIARRNGLTVGELLEANPGVDPRRLLPGQEIRIPE